MKINPCVSSIIDPPLDLMNKKIAAMKSEGMDVISLAQGVSSFNPPESAVKNAIHSIHSGKVNLYSHDAGLREVRNSLSQYLRFKGLSIDPEKELLLTAGASQAFFSALLTIGCKGGKVVLPSPYYFDHQFAVLACGMIPVEVPMIKSDGRWKFDSEAIAREVNNGAQIVVLVSPNNPTGAIIDTEELLEIAQAVARNSAAIISDETYDRFVYEPHSFVCPAALEQLRDHVLTIGSFSKSFALAGWRIGYLSGPVEVIREALKLQDTLIICAPVVSQYALGGAIDGDGEEALRIGLLELDERRKNSIFISWKSYEAKVV